MNRNLPSVSFVATARADNALDVFFRAETLPDILDSYQNICDQLCMQPDVFTSFYPKLKANLRNWKSKDIFEKFDARAKHKCYADGLACDNTRVLVIGAGPCGLRTAIEAQLLGAKVIVVEKRDYISRNNVLRLWPFVIEDLCNLGAKRFVRQFCISSINHVSITQLQCMLLKIALLLGVEVHTKVSFETLIEPDSEKKTGWRAKLDRVDHPVSKCDFDVIVGADGGRSSFTKDFNQKELRSKLAIAITANFVNKRTEAERKVPEISGISYVYNQDFFKTMGTEMGINLENIIYYKDNTHYFVMTPKKSSLIAKGVIKKDLVGAALLDPNNVDQEALLKYAKAAAEFSTKYQLPNLEFAANHYGQPDVSMFDFSTMYAAESSSKVVVRSGYKLLKLLVGDGLLQPFWPTGSGCARGFLSSFDAAWAIKAWSSGVEPLDVLAERESIFKLLAQTTSDNLSKNFNAFTLDPCTRYRNLNKALVSTQQVLCLYDSDNTKAINLPIRKQSVEVRSNCSRLRYNLTDVLSKSKSVDGGLGLSSDELPLSRTDGFAWNRSQSIAHIETHNGNNDKKCPTSESFSNLVSKFETFSSGSLNHKKHSVPSLETVTSTPASKDDPSISINVFGPAARRGISAVSTSSKFILPFGKPNSSRNLKHDPKIEGMDWSNDSKSEVATEDYKPAVGVKLLSAKNTLRKFRRSNSKRGFEGNSEGTRQDVGLVDREPLQIVRERLKRSHDQVSPANKKKESSFRSQAKCISRKLAFKRLRDKYEFGNLVTETSSPKKPKKSISWESTRRFSGVTNFVSNIFG